MAKGESLYTFPKLMDSAKYKKWSRDMAFALLEAELCSYIIRARKIPRKTPLRDKDSEEQLEKCNQRDLQRLEFEEKQCRMIGKIGKMCTPEVVQKFLAMKT